MGKHEKKAWLELVVFGLVSGWLCWRLFFAMGDMEQHFVGYFGWPLLLGYLFISRRDRTPTMDERDKTIHARGNEAGYAALALMLVVLSLLMREEGYREFLTTRSGNWLAAFLIWLAIGSGAIQAGVMVWHHWRDRR